MLKVWGFRVPGKISAFGAYSRAMGELAIRATARAVIGMDSPTLYNSTHSPKRTTAML